MSQMQVIFQWKFENQNRAYLNGQYYYQVGHVEWKSAFEYVQNAQIQIIMCMPKVLSGPLLSIHTFCSIQWVC